MKKVLAVVLVVCVVFGAGTALAMPQRDPRGQRGQQNEYRGGGRFRDMPKEIREKAVELAKLRIDLQEALSDQPLNRPKAMEVYGKIQKLQQEIQLWKFEQRLNRLETEAKQHELNRNVPPAPPAPPAPEE